MVCVLGVAAAALAVSGVAYTVPSGSPGPRETTLLDGEAAWNDDSVWVDTPAWVAAAGGQPAVAAELWAAGSQVTVGCDAGGADCEVVAFQYRCPPCGVPDSDLPAALSAGGWQKTLCLPKFRAAADPFAQPMIGFRTTLPSGGSVTVDIPDAAAYTGFAVSPDECPGFPTEAACASTKGKCLWDSGACEANVCTHSAPFVGPPISICSLSCPEVPVACATGFDFSEDAVFTGKVRSSGGSLQLDRVAASETDTVFFLPICEGTYSKLSARVFISKPASATGNVVLFGVGLQTVAGGHFMVAAGAFTTVQDYNYETGASGGFASPFNAIKLDTWQVWSFEISVSGASILYELSIDGVNRVQYVVSSNRFNAVVIKRGITEARVDDILVE
ncbi:hypothetical protein DIPPA_20948 [Diplonema papillatum]|nr:hypothetical protein DIPPA_20948 [Diplonema papillatum]